MWTLRGDDAIARRTFEGLKGSIVEVNVPNNWRLEVQRNPKYVSYDFQQNPNDPDETLTFTLNFRQRTQIDSTDQAEIHEASLAEEKWAHPKTRSRTIKVVDIGGRKIWIQRYYGSESDGLSAVLPLEGEDLSLSLESQKKNGLASKESFLVALVRSCRIIKGSLARPQRRALTRGGVPIALCGRWTAEYREFGDIVDTWTIDRYPDGRYARRTVRMEEPSILLRDGHYEETSLEDKKVNITVDWGVWRIRKGFYELIPKGINVGTMRLDRAALGTAFDDGRFVYSLRDADVIYETKVDPSGRGLLDEPIRDYHDLRTAQTIKIPLQAIDNGDKVPDWVNRDRPQ
jgi:hypothetical protein